jgi:hypothetical protein
MYLTINKTKKTDKLVSFLRLQNRVPKQAGAFAITTIIYKVIMPLRIAMTLIVTPIVVRKFNIQIPNQ